MTSTLVFPAWIYTQACSFVSPEESRAIRCVHVDVAARAVVATDGHVLLARLVAHDSFHVHTHGHATAPEFWNLPAIPRLGRIKAKAREARQIWIRVERARADSRDVMVAAVLAYNPGEAIAASGVDVLAMESSELGELAFPDWRRVMPAWHRAEQADGKGDPAFNPELLARVAEALRGPRGADVSPVRLRPFGEHHPAVIEYPEDDSAFALIMPMRARPATGPWSAPGWATYASTARAAE